VSLTGLLAVISACAYFNTLYNAKQTYKEAQKVDTRAATAQPQQSQQQSQQSQPPMASPSARQYEEVIEKCKTMIANYPKSKHVDDAMLLSAQALYALGRYDEAVAALDTLTKKYPKSNLRDKVDFLQGKSFYAAGKYDLAAPVLRDFARDHRKSDNRPEALYLLCSSLMELGMYDEAVATLETLEKDHGRSNYRFTAQVEMADILSRKELYQQSLDVYKRLSESRIPESYRYDVWIGMARVQNQLNDYSGAIATLEGVKTLPRSLEKEPVAILLRARAHAALDSTDLAIAEYKDVTTRFARGTYAAEAYYRLGVLYESMDSLQTAQHNYQEVPRAYSGSEFAEDAIRHSGNISRVLKVQETSGDDSPEAIAMRTFSLAEIQLFQFESPEKAIVNYEKVANEFPESEYAPRAVYALGYISGVMQGDTLKAREWYEVLVARYPDSAQAQLAHGFYAGAPLPPPISEWVQKKPSTPPPVTPPAPETRGAAQRPAPRQAAAVDSTRIRRPVMGDTTAVAPQPALVPADTAAAPADSSRGGE
jgi:TolA-binding protein